MQIKAYANGRAGRDGLAGGRQKVRVRAEHVWAAVFEQDDRAVAVGGVAGGGELMQPRAKQVVMNGQAGVLSLMAPLLYFWSPGWMLGGGAPPTASPAPSGGRAARRVHQNSPMMVRPAEVDSTMLTGVLASTS